LRKDDQCLGKHKVAAPGAAAAAAAAAVITPFAVEDVDRNRLT
tara:strand:- start:20 stop:148 length:129 start_codon:yes stop_codon:yes gene_type:complete